MLLRPSPPLPASCAAAPPGTPPDALSAPRQVLGNFHLGPGPLSCPWLLGLIRQDPRSPPLPEKKRTRSHQLIQPRAAAFRCAPDFADKRPGIGGNQGLPRPPPPAKLPPSTSSDPRSSPSARTLLSCPCSLEIEADNKNSSSLKNTYIFPECGRNWLTFPALRCAASGSGLLLSPFCKWLVIDPQRVARKPEEIYSFLGP